MNIFTPRPSGVKSFSFDLWDLVKAELQMHLLETTLGPLLHSWCLDIITHLMGYKQFNTVDCEDKLNIFYMIKAIAKTLQCCENIDIVVDISIL